MKKILVLFLFIGFISCNLKPPGTAVDLDLDWILGNWKRTNDKEGQQTFEHWEKSPGEKFKTFRGLGFTLQGQDTIFKEEMELVLFLDDFWVLKVSGVNEEPTSFVFTKQSKNSFVCENPNNEFPKKIEYYFEDNKLKAKVSADEMEVAFDFEKIN